MNVYDALDMKPVINAVGTATKLGGSLMPPPVLEAMAEASRHFVDLDELNLKVGRRLAELTRNEAAHVSCGASSGLLLSAAACMTGEDIYKIGRLPDTEGLKNQIVMHACQQNPYQLAMLPTGAEIVTFGYSNQTEPWHLEAAITEKTAAVFHFIYRGGFRTEGAALPLESVIEIAHSRGVPVVLDAASQIPPIESLWTYTQMGVDLVIFSGGKGLRGPQGAGLILGRQDLVNACRLNAAPNYAIGRPMKVSKEEIVGLLAAVEWNLERDFDQVIAEATSTIDILVDQLEGLSDLTAAFRLPGESCRIMPVCDVRLTGSGDLSARRDQVVKRLWQNDPPIAVRPVRLDGFVINPETLREGEEQEIIQVLRSIMTDGFS